MELEHTFTVPVGVKQAWDVLLDLPRIAPCMPGATLADYGDETFAGTVKVKLGPVNLTYRGTGRFAEREEHARRVVIEASGRDTRSAGTAAATITATLHPDGDERTEVRVLTDLTVTGRPAQFGRGILADVGGKLIGQFAECLAGRLGEPEAGTGVEASGPAGKHAASPEPSGARVSRADGDRAVGLAAVPTPEEVEAIDLLEVTGAWSALRRYGPYVLLFGGAAALLWALGRRWRR
jgi:carbon monoxide dehydrogenase subunit G